MFRSLFFLILNMGRYEMGDLQLTLEELKTHIRVDFDYADEDDHIIRLGKAALSHVFHSTNRPMEELVEMGGGEFPEELRLAACQLAAHWYRMREVVATSSQNRVPDTYDVLVKPYIWLGGRDNG